MEFTAKHTVQEHNPSAIRTFPTQGWRSAKPIEVFHACQSSKDPRTHIPWPDLCCTLWLVLVHPRCTKRHERQSDSAKDFDWRYPRTTVKTNNAPTWELVAWQSAIVASNTHSAPLKHRWGVHQKARNSIGPSTAKPALARRKRIRSCQQACLQLRKTLQTAHKRDK